MVRVYSFSFLLIWYPLDSWANFRPKGAPSSYFPLLKFHMDNRGIPASIMAVVSEDKERGRTIGGKK